MIRIINSTLLKFVIPFYLLVGLNQTCLCQIDIKKAGGRKIKFTYVNENSKPLVYFNPKCFYTTRVDKKNKLKVTVRMNRCDFSNDTLYLYFHDAHLNYYGKSKNSTEELCVEKNYWEYDILESNSSSKQICIWAWRKLEYKFLCIYYSLMIDNIKTVCRVTFNKKTKEQKTEIDVPNVIKVGAYDKERKHYWDRLGWIN